MPFSDPTDPQLNVHLAWNVSWEVNQPGLNLGVINSSTLGVTASEKCIQLQPKTVMASMSLVQGAFYDKGTCVPMAYMALQWCEDCAAAGP